MCSAKFTAETVLHASTIWHERASDYRDGRCTNALHYSRATFRTREGATYEAAWGRRSSETKCSDLCHRSAGFPRWNSWKLPVSSPWTASSPRKESLERSARRPARPRASVAPGWTLRVEMHSDRWSSWKLKTRRWTGGCCAEVCILSPWSCLWAAPPLPLAPLFDGAVFRLRTATPAQDSSFDRGGGAMHLRVAREVEWSCSGSQRPVEASQASLVSFTRGTDAAIKVQRLSPPLPGPTNQVATLNLWRLRARFWLARISFFFRGKSRGLWKEREVNHTDPMQREAIDSPDKVAQTNFRAINQWGGLSWPFTSISRPLCCYYSLDYSPSAKMSRTPSDIFISSESRFVFNMENLQKS